MHRILFGGKRETQNTGNIEPGDVGIEPGNVGIAPECSISLLVEAFWVGVTDAGFLERQVLAYRETHGGAISVMSQWSVWFVLLG